MATLVPAFALSANPYSGFTPSQLLTPTHSHQSIPVQELQQKGEEDT